MFTGLVEEKGALLARRPKGPDAVLHVGCTLRPLALGESVAVDGACLTVVRITAQGFEADVSYETLQRTTLGSLPHGAPVNLERSVELGGRMGGHLVTGHVDGLCTVTARRSVGVAWAIQFAVEPRLARFVAEKGSVAVNGVSLTVNAVADVGQGESPAHSTFDVVIVPHTQEMTSLGRLTVGAQANLEVDLLARYVARLYDTRDTTGAADDPPLAATRPAAPSPDEIWIDRLRRTGHV